MCDVGRWPFERIIMSLDPLNVAISVALNWVVQRVAVASGYSLRHELQ